MSEDLSRADLDNDQPTDVDRWLEIYSHDDNLFWATDQGHILNVLDELLERLKTAKADAWVAHEEGREAERERIIKLLNSAKGTGNNCNCDDCEQTNYYIDSLVDLIKGEEQ